MRMKKRSIPLVGLAGALGLLAFQPEAARGQQLPNPSFVFKGTASPLPPVPPVIFPFPQATFNFPVLLQPGFSLSKGQQFEFFDISGLLMNTATFSNRQFILASNNNLGPLPIAPTHLDSLTIPNILATFDSPTMSATQDTGPINLGTLSFQANIPSAGQGFDFTAKATDTQTGNEGLTFGVATVALVSSVPEPSTIVLALGGALSTALWFVRRRAMVG